MHLWNQTPRSHIKDIDVFVVLGLAVWKPRHLFDSSLIPVHSGSTGVDGWSLSMMLYPPGPFPEYSLIRSCLDRGPARWENERSQRLNELLYVMESLDGWVSGFTLPQSLVFSRKTEKLLMFLIMFFKFYCFHKRFAGKLAKIRLNWRKSVLILHIFWKYTSIGYILWMDIINAVFLYSGGVLMLNNNNNNLHWFDFMQCVPQCSADMLATSWLVIFHHKVLFDLFLMAGNQLCTFWILSILLKQMTNWRHVRDVFRVETFLQGRIYSRTMCWDR